ncbi:hypothetical protein BH11PLA2_BH11PLA2_36330 [soil metagenome]
MRLTLRTLLAYVDDTLPAADAKLIGQKVAGSDKAREILEKIKKVTRRRGLSVPTGTGEMAALSDPNVVADYLSDELHDDAITEFETLCLESDVHLAEVAACHQILTLLLTDPVRVPPTARQRMYNLVKGPESIPTRTPGPTIPVGGHRPDDGLTDDNDDEATYLMGLQAAAKEDQKARGMRYAVTAALSLGLVTMIVLTWASPTPDVVTPVDNRTAALPTVIVSKPAEPKPEVPMGPMREVAPAPRVAE